MCTVASHWSNELTLRYTRVNEKFQTKSSGYAGRGLPIGYGTQAGITFVKSQHSGGAQQADCVDSLCTPRSDKR
jgi:hypothetical protein